MSTLLVVSASKHGSTAEIAQAIGAEVAKHGVEVTVADIDDLPLLIDFDGYVLGSAVYAGHWVAELRRFVEVHHHLLSARPLWLFSSGPLGDSSIPAEEPAEVADFARSLGALDHRVFEGRLQHEALNLAERAVIRYMHAPYGDFRHWDEIHDWARGIAETVLAVNDDRSILQH
jgi:menaquinone-dependent protoporphyrinogen oxidase